MMHCSRFRMIPLGRGRDRAEHGSGARLLGGTQKREKQACATNGRDRSGTLQGVREAGLRRARRRDDVGDDLPRRSTWASIARWPARARRTRRNSPRAPVSTSAGCASGCTSKAPPACCCIAAAIASSCRPKAVAVLVDETHPACGIGFFSQLPQMIGVAERLPESFRTGLGLDYDALGPEGARGIERGIAPWFRALLVPLALPRVPGVLAQLEAGIDVADVGCGAGVALLTMAKAFPNSRFHGYDISRHALERAEANRVEAGVANATFHDARARPAARRRSLRLRHHLRLPARHDRPGRRDPPDPPRDSRRRHLVRRRHQGAAELRGERREEPDGGDDVRDERADLHVVGALGAGRRSVSARWACTPNSRANWPPTRASPASSRSTSGTRSTRSTW